MSPAQRRAAVAWARRAYRLPERRACRALGACPLTVRYQSVQAPREPLRARLRELAAVRVSYGYRATAHLATPRGLAGESEAHQASVPRRRPYVEAEKAQTTAPARFGSSPLPLSGPPNSGATADTSTSLSSTPRSSPRQPNRNHPGAPQNAFTHSSGLDLHA